MTMPSTGMRSPGRSQNRIVYLNAGDGHFFFDIILDNGGGFRPQSDQFADRAAGAPLGSGFEHFAKFDQGDDDRGSFKIDMSAQGRQNKQGQ